MTVRHFAPCTLQGTVQAPSSKSMAHRLLIGAALARGESIIRGVDVSQDIQATVDCLRLLGAEIRMDGKDVHVSGCDVYKAHPAGPLNCRESASTMRFLIPLCLLSGQDVRLEGSAGLMKRPLTVYEDLAARRSMCILKDETGVWVRGPLERGYLDVRGDVSSQFISGLLFALPLIPGAGWGSRLRIRGTIESRSYIDMTLSVLGMFGIRWIWEDARTLITFCDQVYRPVDTCVEGDHSSAAFWLAGNALGHNVVVEGLQTDSLQGDRVAGQYLEALVRGETVIDLMDCPDLGPVLMMAAAALHGAQFVNTRRLGIKESDRAQCMAAELRKCGAHITVEENSVTVHKSALHTPRETIDGHGDHRIVMAMSMLLTRLGGEMTGADAADKSYPGFFDALDSLTAE